MFQLIPMREQGRENQNSTNDKDGVKESREIKGYERCQLLVRENQNDYRMLREEVKRNMEAQRKDWQRTQKGI